MHPAFSVVFLTTLIGSGQGLFLALFAAELGARAGAVGMPPDRFFVAGAAASLVLAGLGLFASFFHLGRPERAWRTATKWRTSWLSREVIALPLFMAAVMAWGAAHHLASPWTLALGALGVLATFLLFACTGMIYAGIKFFQEWASPWTLVNFSLIGCASGGMMAVPVAAALAPALVVPMAVAAMTLTLAALATRFASLMRNDRLRPKSTPQSATGLRGTVVQKSQGFTGSSFNTREFFHRVTPRRMRAVRATFLQLGFVIPVVIVLAGLISGSIALYIAAVAVQYGGLILERWYFLAQANHPQNNYYQCAS